MSRNYQQSPAFARQVEEDSERDERLAEIRAAPLSTRIRRYAETWRDGGAFTTRGHEPKMAADLLAAADALEDWLAVLKGIASMHCKPNEPYRLYEDRIGVMKTVRAAIAKAEGRS